jgi:predicted Ser/Thr protein kinase
MLAAGLAGGGPAVPSAAEVEAKLPAFEILSVLGHGGMGVVYKARQKTLDRVVALKVLPIAAAATPGFAERFAREAKALARLTHPNIVAVHDSGQSDGLFWLVMEYVDGVNLREAMRAETIHPKDALAIVPQICDALQFAHEHGVVHRDIKPENVLLDATGRVKVADFGLAKLMAPDASVAALTRADQVMGTPHYMAPEQVEHPADVDHRADIYSLGVVFYEMLTGELPLGRFPAPSVKSGIDARIDEIVMRTLAKERAARYQQVAQVKTDMGKAATGAPVKPRPKRWREFLPLAPGDQAKQDRIREAVVGAFLLLAGLNAWQSNQRWPPLLLVPGLSLALLVAAAFWRVRRDVDADAAVAAWRRRRRATYLALTLGFVGGIVAVFVLPFGVEGADAALFYLSFWGLVFTLGLARRWNMIGVLIVILLLAFASTFVLNLGRPKDSPLLSPGAASRLSQGAFRALADKDGLAIEIPADQRARIDDLWRKAQALPASPRVEDVLDLYAPEVREKLLALTPVDVRRLAVEAGCGVPLLPRDVLTRPLADFHLDSVDFFASNSGGTPQSAVGVATAGSVRIRFFFERHGEWDGVEKCVYGRWFFAMWARVDK